jgi:hypothetical protein
MSTLESFTREKLAQIEEVEGRIISRKKRNPKVFEKHQADLDLKEKLVKELREGYAARCPDGRPPEGWDRTSTPVTGPMLKIEVQFKGGAPTYNPEALPGDILRMAGVVEKLSAETVDGVLASLKVQSDELSAELVKEIELAKTTAPWIKPTVLVKPVT